MATYSQVVIGPPGSGKSTYCYGMQQFLSSVGRKVEVVNLDPANDQLLYQTSIDIKSLVSLQEVMDVHELGPNGALVFAMNYLKENIHWLVDQLNNLPEHSYVIFDLPGQVELYTHEDSLHSILKHLEKLDYRLTIVHLVDAHHCTDTSKFISVVLLSLSAMVRLELPHVNVLSKIDLIEQYGTLAFNLDFYTDVLDLRFLLSCNNGDYNSEDNPDRLTGMLSQKFRKMNEALVEIIEDFSLVNFQPLNIQDNDSVKRVIATIDKANGYLFSELEHSSGADRAILNSYNMDTSLDFDRVRNVQEKYLSSDIPVEEHLKEMADSLKGNK